MEIMGSSLVKVDVHFIFHVKSSTGVTMDHMDLPRIFDYIGGIIKGMGSVPYAIGGMPDHIHFVAPLPKTIAIADFVRAIKAESSKWIKKLGPTYSCFAWQDGYGAFSVSPTNLPNVVRYIGNQAVHHTTKSFEDEYKMFLDAYGVLYEERYVFSD